MDFLRRGWRAPFGDLLVGAAAALPVSALLALALADAIRSSLLVLVAGLVQLFLSFGIAGWLAKRREK